MASERELLTATVSLLDAIEVLIIDSANYGSIYELLKNAKNQVYEVRNLLKEGESK